MWRFESVHGFASVGNLYQKMHFAGSNLSWDPKRMKSCWARWNPSKLGWNLRRVASDEMKSATTLPAKRDFITKWFHPPQVDFSRRRRIKLKKAKSYDLAFFWWGMVDSDHRSQWQQIYSLPPLAAREIPHMMGHVVWPLELVIGVEPTTCWLQISCSAIEPHQHFIQFSSLVSAVRCCFLPALSRTLLLYHTG